MNKLVCIHSRVYMLSCATTEKYLFCCVYVYISYCATLMDYHWDHLHYLLTHPTSYALYLPQFSELQKKN